MSVRFFLFISAFFSINSFSWTHFSTRDAGEIRGVLRYHRDLLDDYLIHGVENPGTQITEARGRYITVQGESAGEKYYHCELQTELILSNNTRFSDKVEVEKKCEHVF
ncbi:MAG: hypothetical protein ACKN9V_07105 [Pseudomonadota bacterium]